MLKLNVLVEKLKKYYLIILKKELVKVVAIEFMEKELEL